MPDNKPRSRQRNITGSGTGAYKKGSGLGTGPVGSTGGHSGNFVQHSTGNTSGGNRAVRRGGGGLALVAILVIAYFLFFRGGSDDTEYYSDTDGYDTVQTQTDSSPAGTLTPFGSSAGTAAPLISALTGGSYGDSGIYTDSVYETKPEMLSAADVSTASGTSQPDTTVSSGARQKRTVIKGDGSDTVTIMVYMCGTDLESKHGMGSNDLAEMAQASLSDKVNVVVYTGGCKSWKTSGISSKVNQIYLISKGGMKRLVDDDGNKTMTDPATLSGFIRYCTSNFPASRNELILWDHGGGSVSGYGYDEKNAFGGSMDLSMLDRALNDGGVTFDFIGFDACLMATAENAIMLDKHADYMIASEETEPGIGWYYTKWLSNLSQNTGMSTLDLGRNIIDDYTSACSYQCRGQKTTLSIVDLAEFNDTVPEKLDAFSDSVSAMIKDGQYKNVSDARYNSKEFGQSSRIDQVDLADLALNINNAEGKELAGVIKSSVKYNRASSGQPYANGVAIYFPYRQKSMVNNAKSTFTKIGVNDRYIRCITDAASMQTSGQAAGGSGADIFSMLSGLGSTESFGGDMLSGSFDTSSTSYGGGSLDSIFSLLGAFKSNRSMPGETDADASEYDFYDDRSYDDESAAEFISLNSLDTSALRWDAAYDGSPVMTLSSSQWDLIHDIDLNMFLDDGHGYIDLGLDNVFEFNGDDMYADTSGAWLALNGQVMPYYHTDTYENGDDYAITGYAPCLLNGVRSKLIVVFDNDNPNGYIAGAVKDYDHDDSDDVDTVAKSTIGLNIGDKIQFICDYYDYNLKYDDSYLFGEEITVGTDLRVSDVTVDNSSKVISYRLTDIYNREYWTPALVSE